MNSSDDNVPFKDMQFLRILPLLVSYIKTDRELSKDDVLKVLSMMPEQPNCHIASHKAVLDTALKYEQDEAYAKGIDVVLSEEGSKWLDDFFSKADSLQSEDEDGD